MHPHSHRFRTRATERPVWLGGSATRLGSTALLCLLALAGAASAQEPGEPRDRTPAAVMSFRGADWLERPQRALEERPREVIAAMDLEAGDVVADIGAGSGYFTRLIAPDVMPGGMVYAVDVQPEMLDILRDNLADDGITGVELVLGAPDDPRLPAGSVDWILMVDVYHELEDPQAMLARMRESLAPGGRVALLEYRVEDGTGDHIRAEHRMSVRQVVAEWEAGGFELVELLEFLPSQHMFILRVASDAAAQGPALAEYDLVEAMSAGRVQAAVQGGGADAVTISIRRLRPEPMVVTLGAGAYFDAQGAVGDLVARRDAVVLLDSDAMRSWRVPTHRVQRAAPAPSSVDVLVPLPASEHRDVRDVLWLFQNADVYAAVAPTVEQIAVWIVTEDDGWEALAAHARAGSVHAANAVALATAYVNGAGVDVRARRIWGERELFVPSITDEGLRRAFTELEGN